MSNSAALIVGANGGLGKALVSALLKRPDISAVHGISRGAKPQELEKAIWHSLDAADESAVKELVDDLKQHHQFKLIVVCAGVLHGPNHGVDLRPEKRLEDLNPAALMSYFKTNTVLPAIWLKLGIQLLKGQEPAHLVVFSARVGSIEDNRLGGWYGYRASKSALNMLVKTAQVEYARRASNVTLVSYHPGTVDTALSKPFQANVAKDKLFTADFSAAQLLSFLPELSAQDAPHYIDWQGKTIPW